MQVQDAKMGESDPDTAAGRNSCFSFSSFAVCFFFFFFLFFSLFGSSGLIFVRFATVFSFSMMFQFLLLSCTLLR
uniref:Uncharacterized protein n=1 Tax=Nelumbo nucifera TaxID=4432 RepID=A0A822Z674_NELNU|nr:TPA_asm: hypothetical protein HUJ06_016197 [Nelumbo nucifera]